MFALFALLPMRFSSVMFLSGDCAWATPSTLATLSSWRRFLLATLTLGDALFLGDAFLLGDAFSLGEAYRRFKRGKDKD